MWTDDYPLLNLRKFFMLNMKIISWICQVIVDHPVFDNLVLIVIIWNSIMLCMDDPTSDEDPSYIAKLIDEFFLWFYLAECLLKVTAMGFVFVKNSYLRNGWNVLDFIIVVTSILPKLQGGGGGS